MTHDASRAERVQSALTAAGLELLVCGLPSNVLMLTGYFPVVGNSLALASRAGIALVVPADELELARNGHADPVIPFQSGSLAELVPAREAIRQPLRHLAGALGVGGRVGYEEQGHFQPAGYSALHLYGGSLRDLLADVLPDCQLIGADKLLGDLRSVLTAAEMGAVRSACGIAAGAFATGGGKLRAGQPETEAAAQFLHGLVAPPGEDADLLRLGGFCWCMSGPNAAGASGAFARSRARRLREGEPVLVHANSYRGGFWTDITRTYCLGQPDELLLRVWDAVFAARAAALAAIRPGVRAAEVDSAAREVLRSRGFGDAFRHGTGHGVGFAAIDHNARPRLHPQSDDTLAVGMVFNVEPAVYLEGWGGVRHCDVVAVTAGGAEVLTPFQDRPELLTLPVS